jgi:putative FmdB family regulatory protein
MPTYDYMREDGTVFELRQGINDEPLKKCPETGQSVKRMISGGAGVVYKGEGWYVTDYKDNKPKNGSSGDSDTTAETKSESKTESSSTEKSSD